MGQATGEYIDESRKSKRPFILAAIMLAMFMGAIEGTIVSTAMPAIVSELGGFSLYSWVFSGYLLMNAVTVLIYGKLSDIFGRKPILIFGIIIFLIGSVLCGFAGSMKELIIYRFIQGFGAGAVAPVASTIVGDIYEEHERGPVQGYLSSVWGISAVMGPVLGGILVQSISWRLVFWINIPLGLLSMAGLWFFLHENIEKKKRDIDYQGAVLLTLAISSIMLILVEGGVHLPWTSVQIIGMALFAALALILFVRQEKKTIEPMMPFEIWKDRSILIANIVSLTTGVMIIGISSFLPTFVQGVMGRSPTVAGFTLTAMSIGWPIASTIAGRLLMKIGFKATSVLGGFSLIVGSLVLVFMPQDAGPFAAGLGSFFVGVGMGLTSTSFIVLIQNTVSWERRGIATASNMFMRNLGTTVGAALLGGIMNMGLQGYLDKHNNSGERLTIDSANQLLNSEERAKLPDKAVEVLQEGLTQSLNNIYLIILLFAIVSLLLLFFLPKKDKTA
ncbi:DHA2 family efflux MFS transporter permease subunit [Peribacillus cavernae]|uniref:DHA2 family efflux MFS transporter permease subunit n=1 Tax=Peribacillus cavernae TaxID=1674310 RepID=A0A3S1B860_9BACI|nr:MDR family MFS transporter [Peribacillus cavernae]MDQ0217262.1 EmrB/QacA subfamily drug resistance transporter [Peribacillus cavernae]RUQ30269.1 DHA2 family efflux MFS transporter permease subunit [Peribacillus cavernae]